MPPAAPFDVEIHEMELCSVLKAQEEDGSKSKKGHSETAMDEIQAEEDDEEEEAEEKISKDMAAEEQKTTLDAVEKKAGAQPPESDMTH